MGHQHPTVRMFLATCTVAFVAACGSTPGSKSAAFPPADTTTSASGDAALGETSQDAGVPSCSSAYQCDDMNPCTVDTCAAEGTCAHAVSAASCDDGDACTSADTCIDGACKAGAQVSCDDGNPCTVDSCDASLGCVHEPNTDKCDDGKVCTGDDACFNGTCTPGAAVVCDDGNACTEDSCDSKSGCKTEVMVSGAACDSDGLPCTEETCDGLAKCQYKGLKAGTCAIGQGTSAQCFDADAVNPTNPCQICAPSSDQTAWSTLPAGQSCGAETKVCIRHRCSATGACEAQPDDTMCPPSTISCATAACDPNFGCKAVPLSTDVTCNGSDGIVCTVEHCDGASKCDNLPVPENGLCNDGFACTLDLCTSKGCTNAADSSYGGCDVGNGCTNDACVPGSGTGASGCVHTNNPLPCDTDGFVCTEDVCQGGTCTAGPIASGNCHIGAACQKTGDKSLAGCELCDPGQSQTAWSIVTAGIACPPDAIGCTVDACDGKGVCDHSVIDSSSCLIGGVCLGSGDVDDSNCQTCDPSKSQTVWSPVAAGTICIADSVACTIDACDGKGVCAHDKVVDGSCYIDGQCVLKDTLTAGGCQSCLPATSQTRNGPMPGSISSPCPPTPSRCRYRYWRPWRAACRSPPPTWAMSAPCCQWKASPASQPWTMCRWARSC